MSTGRRQEVVKTRSRWIDAKLIRRELTASFPSFLCAKNANYTMYM